jgi:hypothetical protein
MLGGFRGRLKSRLKRAWGFVSPFPEFDFDISEGWEEWADLAFGPIPPAGLWRITIDGEFARFQSSKHGDPERLHTLFVDASDKFAAKERFAGYDFVAGHFFAADAAGARSEAEHYRMDLSSRFLLEVQLRLPDVLDLTNYEALPDYIQRNLDDSEKPVTPHIALLALLDQTSGGNKVLTNIGVQAVKDGYRGVKFFGARILDDKNFESITSGTAYALPGDPERMYEHLRRQNPPPINVVVFSAANVVRYTRAFRVDRGEWRENPLFEADEAELDHLYVSEGLPSPSAMDLSDAFRIFPEGDEWLEPDHRRPNRRDS